MASVDDQLLGAPRAGATVAGPDSSSPPPEAVRQAIIKSRESDGGRSKIMKVLYLDDSGHSVGEWASTQIPENPWDGQTMGGLQEPPYRMEQMTFLAEMHPVHSSALDQKTADICGKGWEWEPLDDRSADEELMDEMEEWWQGLSQDDEDTQEVITSTWLDVETVGWGLVECARDPQGVLQRIYHVPGHTVRAHRNGFALCQVRDQRKVWFRRWGATDLAGKRVEVDQKTGSIKAVSTPANDLFVIRRNARRSTWYGIPSYVSAIGWITLAMAARDDNLLFFANRREPRWAIILTGLSDDAYLEEDIRRAFTVDLRQPYRNLILPISGPGRVDFQKLSDTSKDGSFEKLSERADKAIMIAHRVPSGRIANAQVGPLGGNNTVAENRIYKDGVVNPGQELLNNRLNKFIAVEWEIYKSQKPMWKLRLDDLDVSSEREQLDDALMTFHGDMITLREARAKLRLGPLMIPGIPELDPETGETLYDPETGEALGTPETESPFNDMIFTQLPGAAAQAGTPGTQPSGAGSLTNPNPEAIAGSREMALHHLLAADVADLLQNSREVMDGLEELRRSNAEQQRP